MPQCTIWKLTKKVKDLAKKIRISWLKYSIYILLFWRVPRTSFAVVLIKNPCKINKLCFYLPYIVYRRIQTFFFQPPFFYIFLWKLLFLTISPQWNTGYNKHKNEITRESYSFMFRRLWNKITYFFISIIFISKTRVKFDLE